MTISKPYITHPMYGIYTGYYMRIGWAIDTNCWWRQEPPNHYCHQLYHVTFTESIDIVRKYTKPSHGRVTTLRDDLDDIDTLK